ncbi:MAG: TlpA disulfide reductase family protein [Candidatus Delongbacteria bacterium]
MRYSFTLSVILFTFVVFGNEFKKAPGFRLQNTQGEFIELDSLITKGPVLINFWASWCKPCRQELPDIYEIKKDFGSSGLSVITITIDKPSSVRKAVSLLKRKNLDLILLKDTDMKVFKMYGGRNTVPFTFLLNSRGEIVFSKRSHTDYDELSNELKKLTE